MATIFSKNQLLKTLKSERLPHSYMTLLEYERKGIIPRPETAIGFGNGKWRFYTKEEIYNIIVLVRKYVAGQKLN